MIWLWVLGGLGCLAAVIFFSRAPQPWPDDGTIYMIIIVVVLFCATGSILHYLGILTP